jgi:hypothetical protein
MQAVPISCEFEPCSWQGVLDKVCRLLAAGRWFCPGIPFFFTNKTDRHDITEIMLKMVLKRLIIFKGSKTKVMS